MYRTVLTVTVVALSHWAGALSVGARVGTFVRTLVRSGRAGARCASARVSGVRWTHVASAIIRRAFGGGAGAGGESAARTSRTRRPAAPCTIWSPPSSARTARRTFCSRATGSPPLGSVSENDNLVSWNQKLSFHFLLWVCLVKFYFVG